MEREKTNSFVMYRSFVESIRTLDEGKQLNALNMVIDYALDGKEPEEEGIIKTLFLAFRVSIDANFQNRENGKKGGRPKGSKNKKTPVSEIKTPGETYEDVYVDEDVNEDEDEDENYYADYKKADIKNIHLDSINVRPLKATNEMRFINV